MQIPVLLIIINHADSCPYHHHYQLYRFLSWEPAEYNGGGRRRGFVLACGDLGGGEDLTIHSPRELLICCFEVEIIYRTPVPLF